ncbi:Inner membrane protein YqiK [compost metagenome]
MPDFLIIPAVIVGVIIVLGLTFWSRYKTVSADKAMIVTGSMLGGTNVNDTDGKKIKIVRGGGAFIWPIFQRADFMSLVSHKLDTNTPEVYTEQGVPVLADGVAIIKIGGSVEDVATAAEQFLGKPAEALKQEAQEVLEGHLRAIIGKLSVEEVYKDKERFAQEVQEVAAKDLKKMGLIIVSFTIKDVRDKHGYLEALGKPRIAAVKRDADIAEAEALRDSRIKKAEAEEQGKKAELIRDTNVAEASKENQLKVASFKKESDVAKAEADQAYAIQESKSRQNAVEEEMKVELVRKERQIDVETKEIARREKQYDAEVKKKADAERYAVEQAAEADKAKRINEADAEKYRIEAQATAQAAQVRLEGLAEAEANKAKGSADAEVIRLRGIAEAEAKEKLADALNKFGEAAVLEMVVKMLPDLAAQVAAPLANIDNLTVVDTGNGAGAARVSNYVTELMATAPQMLKQVSGIDVESLIKGLINKGSSTIPTDKVSDDFNPALIYEAITNLANKE